MGFVRICFAILLVQCVCLAKPCIAQPRQAVRIINQSQRTLLVSIKTDASERLSRPARVGHNAWRQYDIGNSRYVYVVVYDNGQAEHYGWLEPIEDPVRRVATITIRRVWETKTRECVYADRCTGEKRVRTITYKVSKVVAEWAGLKKVDDEQDVQLDEPVPDEASMSPVAPSIHVLTRSSDDTI